jgi:hypothetical protein
VPEDRAVLHEAVAEEQLLPRPYIGAREDLAAAGVDDTDRNGRLGLVRPIGEEPEHEEAEQEHERNRLYPAAGDEQRPALRRKAHS